MPKLSQAERAAVTPELLSGMALVPLESDRPDDRSVLYRVSWTGRRDSALGWIRTLLPQDALVLRMFDRLPGQLPDDVRRLSSLGLWVSALRRPSRGTETVPRRALGWRSL